MTTPTNNGLPEDCPGVAYWDGSRFYNRVPGAQMLVSEVEILPVGSRDRLEKLEAFVRRVGFEPIGDAEASAHVIIEQVGNEARAISKEKK